MKRKKSPGSVFQWTVITVLTLVAVYLTHDFRRARVLMATAPVPTSRISADGGDSAETRRSGGTSASLGSSNEAKAILERTIERIESLKSVTAKIDMRVRVGKVSVDGNGKYEALFLPSNDSQQHSRTLCYGGTSLSGSIWSCPATRQRTNREKMIFWISSAIRIPSGPIHPLKGVSG